MKIMSVREALDGRGRKIFVYGPPGSGKTTAIASLPGRVLIASAEDGLESLRGVDEERVKVLPVRDAAELEDAIAFAKSDDFDFDWLAVDGLSEITTQITQVEMAANSDSRKYTPRIGERVGEILRALRDLRCGVYVTCGEYSFQEENGAKRTMYRPLLTGGRLQSDACGVFDYVFRIVITVKGEHQILTHLDPCFFAKDRSGKLERIEVCDLGAILNKIQ
jgi:hypothetical protein